jgi:hypothetical protein
MVGPTVSNLGGERGNSRKKRGGGCLTEEGIKGKDEPSEQELKIIKVILANLHSKEYVFAFGQDVNAVVLRSRLLLL